MGLKERLLLFIEFKGIDKATFERKSGLSNGFIDKAGDNTRVKSLDRISTAFPELNIYWLRTGDGEMLKSGNIRVSGDGNISNTGIVGGDLSIDPDRDLSSLTKKLIEAEKEVIKLKGEIAARDETIKGLRNELAIRIEMVSFLQQHGRKASQKDK